MCFLIKVLIHYLIPTILIAHFEIEILLLLITRKKHVLVGEFLMYGLSDTVGGWMQKFWVVATFWFMLLLLNHYNTSSRGWPYQSLFRSTYSRGKEKEKKRKTGTGLDEVDQRRWKFFEHMRFLDDFIIPKSTVSNLPVTSNDVSSMFCIHLAKLQCIIICSHSHIILYCQGILSLFTLPW